MQEFVQEMRKKAEEQERFQKMFDSAIELTQDELDNNGLQNEYAIHFLLGAIRATFGVSFRIPQKKVE